MQALGLKPADLKVGELAWLLLQRSLLGAVRALVDERRIGYVEDTPPETRPLEEALDDLLQNQEVVLPSDFFRYPRNLPVLEAIQPAVAEWLIDCGLTAFDEREQDSAQERERKRRAAARAIAARVPAYFASASYVERRDEATLYAPLVTALEASGAELAEEEWAWRLYGTRLHEGTQRPLFEEAFSLADVYVPLRATLPPPARRDRPAQPRAEPMDALPKEPLEVVDLRENLRRWLDSAPPHDSLRVISGDPGGGKSSFARMFAAEVAAEGRFRVLLAPLHRFPHERSLESGISEFVRLNNLGLGSPLDPKESAPLLLILDALDELALQDEVGQHQADDFVREVCNVLTARNQSGLRLRVLITGRPLAVRAAGAAVKEQTLTLLSYLIPKRERDGLRGSEELIGADQRDLWWQKYGEQKGRKYPGLPDELKREEIRLDEITAQPLLNYLVALSWERGKIDFTEEVNRNAIYANLLDRVHERPWGKKKPEEEVAREPFFRGLEEVALLAWRRDGRTAALADIRRLIEGNTDLTASLADFLDPQKPRGLICLLMGFFFRGGEEGSLTLPTTVVFTHKSFGEYLAARRLVRGLSEISQALAAGGPYGMREEGALEEWAKLTGPASLTHEILAFLRDEVALQDKQAATAVTAAGPHPLAAPWQATLVKLISFMLQRGMPMEKLGIQRYQEMDAQARNAETALLAALDACARVTETVSDVAWPSKYTFHAWLNRLQGELIGRDFRFNQRWEFVTGSIPPQCLSYLDLDGASLVGASLVGASLVVANLAGANLDTANLDRASPDGASLVGSIRTAETVWPEGFNPDDLRHGMVLAASSEKAFRLWSRTDLPHFEQSVEAEAGEESESAE
jgi:hypothetical protein